MQINSPDVLTNGFNVPSHEEQVEFAFSKFEETFKAKLRAEEAFCKASRNLKDSEPSKNEIETFAQKQMEYAELTGDSFFTEKLQHALSWMLGVSDEVLQEGKKAADKIRIHIEENIAA